MTATLFRDGSVWRYVVRDERNDETTCGEIDSDCTAAEAAEVVRELFPGAVVRTGA